MNQALKDAAWNILVVYATFCLFAACMGSVVIADHYGLWNNDRPPNDVPLVKDVERSMDEVFEALEVVIDEVRGR